jgi:hypothetical protein
MCTRGTCGTNEKIRFYTLNSIAFSHKKIHVNLTILLLDLTLYMKVTLLSKHLQK